MGLGCHTNFANPAHGLNFQILEVSSVHALKEPLTVVIQSKFSNVILG